MSAARRTIDKPLLFLTALLVFVGVFVFSSASLGLLARGSTVTSMALNHLLLGLGGGTLALFTLSRLNYRLLKTLAPYAFGASLILTALVFVPGIGYSAGGAARWIAFAGFSMQPSELLKLTSVMMMAYLLVEHRTRIQEYWGLALLGGVLAIPAALVLMQPDTGTFGVIACGVCAVYFAAGTRLRDIAIIAAVGIILLATLIFMRPYVKERVLTFINPSHDPRGSSYQVRQSLIAIGSGGLVGRGYGQSIQKFEYLPEPVNDSIFAVASEEFGFLGSTLIILMFIAFAARGYWLATKVPDAFGALLIVGIVTYISIQAFINIASMLSLMPLTGIPLVFMSQGGTALLVALSAVGVVLSVSRSAAR